MIPLSSNADAYTISSDLFASQDCHDFSCYNLVNRKSPADVWPVLAKDSRMVFYGINNALRTIFQQVTMDDVKRSAAFMKRAHSFGGPLYFPQDKWEWIVKYNNGYLPIQIGCIPEGTTFFPNEPVLHISNTIKGFGEFAAFVEARLLGTVSIATATATMIRHWLEFCRQQVKIENELLGRPTDLATLDSEARWMIHNFGDRACACTEESVIKGKAHLLSFFGTDSFSAALEAFEEGAKDPTASSIYALAHRNVQGHHQEVDAFHAVVDATKDDKFRIVSLVADCYNYNNAVDRITNMAHHNPDVVHVIRPDSGDPFTVLHTIFQACVDRGLYKEENGYKLPTNVRFIYGDSVKPAKQLEVMEKLREAGMLTTKWGIWGVGGALMTQANRDSLSSAFKLCVKGLQNEPVVKLSETKGKLSIPYMTHLVRDFGETEITTHRNDDCVMVSPYGKLVRQNYYVDGDLSYEPFDKVQERAINSFDELNKWAVGHPTFGMNRENLHPNIRQLQDEFYERYQ